MAAPPPPQAAAPQRRRVPDGMRVNVTISTGARVGFKHCDTFVAVPSLASTAGGTQAAGGSAAHRTAYTPATVSAANARMMDRFDVSSVSCGSLAIQAPTRVLPDKPVLITPAAAPAPPAKNKATAKGKGNKAKDSKANKDKDEPNAAVPQSTASSSGGAAAVTEADLFLSVSSYRWPAPQAPARQPINEPATPASTTHTATPRRGGAEVDSEKPSTPAASSSAATEPGKTSATVNPLTPAEKGAASEQSSPVTLRSNVTPAPPEARVSALVDRGAAIMWSAHPTTFSLALVPEPIPADSSTTDAPAIPLSAAPSPGTAIHAGSGPSFGALGAVQIAAIEFSSRCTASTTFTTHRNWRMATGCYDRRSALAQQRAHEASRHNEPASMHEVFSTPAAPARAQRAQSADFSPAAASDGTQTVEGGGQHSERLGNDSVTPIAGPNPNVPAAELWSIFGFINGDIVVFNHATRSVLKRHNSCRLGTRAVTNAAVSSIVRVPREGRDDDTLCAASTSALVTSGKHECDCTTGGSSDGGKSCAHNAMTCVFGDVVVGFDNGTVLVLRLNQTGGFIDDDRAAWFGYSAITTIKPCPAHPRLLALGSSDGIVRFVHFPSSFIVRRSEKEEADLNGSTMLAVNAMTSEDAGTVNDTRLLALTRELSAHGGVSALDWIPDGTGVVVGCQDDTLCLVTTAIDTYGGGGARHTVSAGAVSTPSGDVAVQSISSYDQNAAGGLPSRSVTPQQGEAQPAQAGSGQPAPIYVDVRGFVRRKFHRGWVRHVCVLPILSEVPARDEEPQSPSLSVTDQESVKLGGLGSRVIQATEVSHIALCAAEDGTVSVWHLPTREQTMHASPQRHSGGGAAPPLGMLTSSSFVANPSFATPGSRPATAGVTPGTLDRNPSFIGAGGLGHSPAVSLGRQPCGSLPRLTRVLASPHTRGPAETVLDDTVLAIAPLPVSTPWWLQDRLVGGDHDSPADGGPLEFPPLFAAVTAKGSCYVWRVETPDAA